jgi:hypothetical protein
MLLSNSAALQGAGSGPRLAGGFFTFQCRSKPQNSASAHPIKGVRNLDLVEHGQQMLHRPRRVALSRDTFAHDASCMLQRV